MKLSNSFSIDRPVAEVFDAFLEIERVATCMPGSRLTGSPEPDVYDGEVKVKVGPLRVAYTGQLRILEADRATKRLTMRAKGREQRGSGNADAHIIAQLSDHDGGTLVEIDTELNIRGKVAQFGRGVIGEVTEGIIKVFANNLEQMLTSGTSPAPKATGTTPLSADVGTAIADPAPATGTDDLDAWKLIVRPLLDRHASSIATVVFSGFAAYLGARSAVRRHSRPRER